MGEGKVDFLQEKLKKATKNIPQIIAAGFSESQAEVLFCAGAAPVCCAMGYALSQQSDEFSSLTHAYYNIIASKALEGMSKDEVVAPELIKPLKELVERDEAWKVLEQQTLEQLQNSEGITLYAPTTGLYHFESKRNDLKQSREAVVCIQSRPYNPIYNTFHSAVLTLKGSKDCRDRYSLPPLTLFTVLDIAEEDGLRIFNVQLTYTIPSPTQRRIPSTRSMYRKSLDDLIGPMPDDGGAWTEMCDKLQQRGRKLLDQQAAEAKDKETDMKRDCKSKMTSEKGLRCIEKTEAIGFNRQQAEILYCCSSAPVCRAIGDAIKGNDKTYAWVCHAFYNIIANKAISARCVERGEEYVAPNLYKNLQELQDRDPEWQNIVKKDDMNFRGFTSYSPITGLYPESESVKGKLGAVNVKFVSRAPNPQYSTLHSAVPTLKDGHGKENFRYTIPPLTLFKVLREDAAFEFMGETVQKKLITVQLTYLVPRALGEEEGFTSPRKTYKFMSRVTDLKYGDILDTEGGLTGLLGDELVLTMEREFYRNDQWTSWNGQLYSARNEWDYVNGPAREGEKGVAVDAVRDSGHHGWTKDRFLKEINAKLQDCKLMEEELLSLRLYTGFSLGRGRSRIAWRSPGTSALVLALFGSQGHKGCWQGREGDLTPVVYYAKCSKQNGELQNASKLGTTLPPRPPTPPVHAAGVTVRSCTELPPLTPERLRNLSGFGCIPPRAHLGTSWLAGPCWRFMIHWDPEIDQVFYYYLGPTAAPSKHMRVFLCSHPRKSHPPLGWTIKPSFLSPSEKG